jgi:hypothetical protein
MGNVLKTLSEVQVEEARQAYLAALQIDAGVTGISSTMADQPALHTRRAPCKSVYEPYLGPPLADLNRARA